MTDKKSIRVRFAPSPTGFLHIGGARTALFNWLFARHHGGSFILRIEDTDASRNSSEAVELILNGLAWLGLDWDEGPVSSNPDQPVKGGKGPYFQSMRRSIYQGYIEKLLNSGQAYQSDGAIKFKMNRDPVVIHDLVVGDVERKLTDREEKDPDFVIVRSDGQPVFHLVNVIDDMEMGITHVIRGEDHLSNTSKHIALFKAFEMEPPAYAHIPLILNQDGSKMSKRDQGASMLTYMQEGYVPDAVCNYLSLLGWSPKDDTEKMSMNEIVHRFDLSGVLRHNARFDLEKLNWLNGEYLRTIPLTDYCRLAEDTLTGKGISLAGIDPDYFQRAMSTCQEKVRVLADLADYAGFYFQTEIDLDDGEVANLFTQARLSALRELIVEWEGMEGFQADNLQDSLKAVCVRNGIKARELVHPVRYAVTGRTIGPSLYHLLEIVGKEIVLSRLKKAMTRTQSVND